MRLSQSMALQLASLSIGAFGAARSSARGFAIWPVKVVPCFKLLLPPPRDLSQGSAPQRSLHRASSRV